MKFDRRLISQAVVSTVLASLLSFLLPVFVDRRDFTTAVHEYVKNPTVDNETTMERERAKNERIALVTHLEAAAVLFVLINLGWFLAARRSGKTQPSGR